MLSFGGLGIGALELMGGPGTSLTVMESIGSSGVLVASSAKLAVAFPVVYHYLGALRHFVWDYYPEKYLYNDDVAKSSMALIGSAGLISLGFAIA